LEILNYTIEDIMTYFELMEKRIDAAYTAKNRCKEGSWGDNYWTNVIAQLMRMLNAHINDKKILKGESVH
tara:strand:- start:282 stop:491 length:210 start_codon:yes stop_codon:yes gene_type:complete